MKSGKVTDEILHLLIIYSKGGLKRTKDELMII